jgi:lactate 2-monooxygenase
MASRDDDNDKNSDTAAAPEERREYAPYQQLIYATGVLAGQKPVLTCDPVALRQKAKEAMSPEGFSYVAGAAGEGATADANRLAFRQWKIVPRMMRPTVPRDLSVTLFGKTYREYFARSPPTPSQHICMSI